MKNKSNNYEIKLYILSDTLTEYTLKFKIYSDKNQKGNFIIALIDTFLEKYYNKGYTVYTDKSYTLPEIWIIHHITNSRLVYYTYT